MRKRRKKLQGSSGKMFSEGWIEFTDKTVAKQVRSLSAMNELELVKSSCYNGDTPLLMI